MVFEVHHMEGFDWDNRSFSRDVRIEVGEKGYSGTFGYEGLRIKTDTYPTVAEVLTDATKRLYIKGFRGLRSRVNFREDRYLAEREPWIDYASPA